MQPYIGIAITLTILPLAFSGEQLKGEKYLNIEGYDAIIFVSDANPNSTSEFAPIMTAINDYHKFNPEALKQLCVVPAPHLPAKRIINSPTGPLNRDYDDSRRIYEAALSGAKKAHELNLRSPLLVLGPLESAPLKAVWMKKSYPLLNAIMGALDALYMPLEVRELKRKYTDKYEMLGVFQADETIVQIAHAMESGRKLARDICGSDEERMTALKIVDYLHNEFDSFVNLSKPMFSWKAEKIDTVRYPFSAAVERAALSVPRHAGRIIQMQYQGEGEVEQTLILTGKGITFDSGGANIKIDNYMLGMHRDKCGAASVAGLFRTLLSLQPPNLKVIGYLGFVRNSIGADAVMPDEIITTLAGRRVRMVNTDAEGRMVLADLLYYAKEDALKETNPYIFSVATLTGHAMLTYKCYTAVMDNGPAAVKKVAQSLQRAGDSISDMFEVSTIRREDYEAVKSDSEYEELMQCYHKSKSEYARGHQYPAAFLIQASGLDKHSIDSKIPLPYTHVDIFPASRSMPNYPSGASLMAFTVEYVLPKKTEYQEVV